MDIGWAVAAVAFALHVAALVLAPISIGQAGGLVFLAVLAERFSEFELGRRQWTRIGLVAVSLALLTLTGQSEGGANSGYSLAGMIVFEAIARAPSLVVCSSAVRRLRRLAGGEPAGAWSGHPTASERGYVRRPRVRRRECLESFATRRR